MQGIIYTSDCDQRMGHGYLNTKLKIVISSNLFMTMLDLKPTKQHIQQSAMIQSRLPTQCAIIAAVNEDPSWETEEMTSSTRMQ